MKHITSRDNSLFKQLRKLADSSRERRKAGQALLDGAHLVQAYAQTFGPPELLIVAEDDCTADALQLLQDLPQAEKIMLPPAMFAELSPVATPTGLLALIGTPQLPLPAAVTFALLVEDIQDPGNLGSMLRSAAAAGVQAVYLSANCADAWSPKTLRGGQGAHFVLPIMARADLLEVATHFQGRVLAADLHGEPLYGCDLSGPTAFIIGNEGAGLSATLLAAASDRISIPMLGAVESLNAAAAAAVCLFERVRQVQGQPD
ncbi:MAG TPA: RNA methyltransferase [Methylophilaceae bacterium]|nr:RNA methyltransferase [Methylophilaceae bacterium]